MTLYSRVFCEFYQGVKSNLGESLLSPPILPNTLYSDSPCLWKRDQDDNLGDFIFLSACLVVVLVVIFKMTFHILVYIFWWCWWWFSKWLSYSCLHFWCWWWWFSKWLSYSCLSRDGGEMNFEMVFTLLFTLWGISVLVRCECSSARKQSATPGCLH